MKNILRQNFGQRLELSRVTPTSFQFIGRQEIYDDDSFVGDH